MHSLGSARGEYRNLDMMIPSIGNDSSRSKNRTVGHILLECARKFVILPQNPPYPVLADINKSRKPREISKIRSDQNKFTYLDFLVSRW